MNFAIRDTLSAETSQPCTGFPRQYGMKGMICSTYIGVYNVILEILMRDFLNSFDGNATWKSTGCIYSMHPMCSVCCDVAHWSIETRQQTKSSLEQLMLDGWQVNPEMLTAKCLPLCCEHQNFLYWFSAEAWWIRPLLVKIHEALAGIN